MGNVSHKILREQMYRYGLKSANGKPLSISMLEFILQNPFYYGLMRYKGHENTHKYKPLITKELFDQCKAVRESYNKKPFQYAARNGMAKSSWTCASTRKPMKSSILQQIRY